MAPLCFLPVAPTAAPRRARHPSSPQPLPPRAAWPPSRARTLTVPILILRCTAVSSHREARERQTKCIRCGAAFLPSENHSRACFFHGDIVGNRIDYNLYEDHHFDDPSLDGKPGPRFARRWGCCQETDADADPCKMGWHLSYDNADQMKAKDVSLVLKG